MMNSVFALYPACDIEHVEVDVFWPEAEAE